MRQSQYTSVSSVPIHSHDQPGMSSVPGPSHPLDPSVMGINQVNPNAIGIQNVDDLYDGAFRVPNNGFLDDARGMGVSDNSDPQTIPQPSPMVSGHGLLFNKCYPTNPKARAHS